MNEVETCDHGNSAPLEVVTTLAEYQGGVGRHKCVICAYQAGVNDANRGEQVAADMETCLHGKSAPFSTISGLQESQAGAGRHKCAVCAYHAGFYWKLGQLTELQLPIGTLEEENPPEFVRQPQDAKRVFQARKSENYSERDARNRRLGYRGELLVMHYEKRNLLAADRPDLADAVEHVSRTLGDGLGYDIISFTPEGEEKHIEVKTTVGSSDTPFLLTANEVEYCKLNPGNYYLYRLYSFDEASDSAKFYVHKGDLEAAFHLVATRYKAFRTLGEEI